MRIKSVALALIVVFAFLIGGLVTSSDLVPSLSAQGVGDAFFTAVKYSPKIYEFTEDEWSFTVYNANCTADISGRSWFFFKFYINDRLWKNEYKESWSLDKGSNIMRTYPVSLGSGPAVKNVRIELYWNYYGAQHLQNTTSFSEQVVKLFVTAWSTSSLTVEKGKAVVYPLVVNLRNGGNDYMYSVRIDVVDSAGLEITPRLQALQDIANGETKVTGFSVTAPSLPPQALTQYLFKLVTMTSMELPILKTKQLR